MIKIIEKDVTKVKFDELRSRKVTEVIFEDPNGWVLAYDECMFDYWMEYSQSTGRGEIAGTYVKTVGSGEIEMGFTADGKENKGLIDRYTSTMPKFDYATITYREFIKKS